MSAIVTADTHWNDNPRDESRWGLLDWLATDVQADELFILGDLTVAKNNHPARMVNRLVDQFVKLSQHYKHIYILKGNHDYTDPDCPFFGFLEHNANNISFIREPLERGMTIGSWVFMPAGTNWQEHQFRLLNKKVFAHVTFDGSISETGYQLTGVSPHFVREARATVIAGDVHKRQTLLNGAIEYVGAPYHIHFGDDYEPRVMLIQNDGSRSNLFFPSPRKFTQVIKSLAELYRIAIKPGDQIKIIAQMRRADLPDWKNWRDAIKEQADKEGWRLYGPELKLQPTTPDEKVTESARRSNETLVEDYATRQKAGKAHLEIGQILLKLAKQ
jgi:DNA repair exonuclease SbcCD nuclease subunit